jgi:hypothetical protein
MVKQNEREERRRSPRFPSCISVGPIFLNKETARGRRKKKKTVEVA